MEGMKPSQISGPAVSIPTRARPVLGGVPPISTTGVGALPHRDADAAAAFSLEAFDIPSIPSLPRRSPAEAPVAQALAGVAGVSTGQYGAIAVDVERLDPDAAVTTDLHSDHFAGFRAFLDVAADRGHSTPVKWQFVGPISVGRSLIRAGARPEIAFDVALRAVVGHLQALSSAVAAALPGSAQIVLLDEPSIGGLMQPGFPIAPDRAIDLLSTAMASVQAVAAVGVHTCADVDVATLLESGPQVLSLPVSSSVTGLAGYLERFLQHDGWIAWGAVATEGPIGVTSTRSWHQLSTVWRDLVHRGCDPDRLRAQAVLTPQCGLGSHSTAVAERVCHSLRDVARSARRTPAAALLTSGG